MQSCGGGRGEDKKDSDSCHTNMRLALWRIITRMGRGGVGSKNTAATELPLMCYHVLSSGLPNGPEDTVVFSPNQCRRKHFWGPEQNWLWRFPLLSPCSHGVTRAWLLLIPFDSGYRIVMFVSPLSFISYVKQKHMYIHASWGHKVAIEVAYASASGSNLSALQFFSVQPKMFIHLFPILLFLSI